MKILTTALLTIFLAGCSSKGFNRGELKQQIGIGNPVTTDNDIKIAMSKKANLPKPFKLAIYYKNPRQTNKAQANWRWTDEDKELITKATEKLQEEKVISKVFPIISSLTENEDLKSLRLAAAQHGADALLIITGVSDIDRYINSWGWSYALILPVFFVNGSKADTLFISNASMWDVRNEFLYLTAESEGSLSQTYAAASGDSDKDLIIKAKNKSLENLHKQIIEMIKGS